MSCRPSAESLDFHTWPWYFHPVQLPFGLQQEQRKQEEGSSIGIIATIVNMSAAARSSNIARSAVTRSVARRQMSSEPKMHKASDKWGELLSKRPPKDEIDTHVSLACNSVD